MTFGDFVNLVYVKFMCIYTEEFLRGVDVVRVDIGKGFVRVTQQMEHCAPHTHEGATFFDAMENLRDGKGRVHVEVAAAKGQVSP
jgi:hypothetical protein